MLVQQTLDKMDAIGLTAQMAGFNPIGPGRFWAIADSRGAHLPRNEVSISNQRDSRYRRGRDQRLRAPNLGLGPSQDGSELVAVATPFVLSQDMVDTCLKT